MNPLKAIAILAVLLVHSAVFAAESTPQPLYARPCTPQVVPAFLPLPIGAVEPQGWLRDWAVSARNGVTGHLDEWHPVYADGWKGTPIKWTGAKADGTGWPIEQSAYWMDGALRLGLVLHDEALIAKIRARLDPIVDGVNQADAGTSFVYWKKNFKPAGFDSWAHSQLGRALVALYQGTGDQRVLAALNKVYAAYAGDMGRVDFGDVTGLCNLEAMMETYSYTGDKRILDRALAAIAKPGPATQFKDWEAGRLQPGHMVILYENIRLPSIMYPWTGDTHLLQSTLGAWKWLDDRHMQPYGVASGEEYAAGIGPFRKTETCDVTAMLLGASWLYRIQGEGEMGDRMEKAFFNAAAAPLARDGETMSYYQSPNRIRSELGKEPLPAPQPGAPGANGILFHKLGCPEVLCCVGAVNRIIPNYIIHMWMATCDNGLAATLYGPCSVSAKVGSGVPVRITMATDYPFNDFLHLAVEPEKAVGFPLYLRIPGWCRKAVLTVNGQAIPAVPDAKGFVKIVRVWAKGDKVELRLPMTPQVARGYATEVPLENRGYFGYRGAEYFKAQRLPYASVSLGPLLFSLPIADVDANTPVKDAKWQYALDTEADAAAGITVERTAMPVRWDWPLKSPVTLKVPVQPFDWKPTDAQALPDKPLAAAAGTTAELVPYGCTKFRISMFPVTERAWKNPPPGGLFRLPDGLEAEQAKLLGSAGRYEDAAASAGAGIGYINQAGAGIECQSPSLTGQRLKIRYAAIAAATLTLVVNGQPQPVQFPATAGWSGPGTYAEIAVPVAIPENAVVQFRYAGKGAVNLDWLKGEK